MWFEIWKGRKKRQIRTLVDRVKRTKTHALPAEEADEKTCLRLIVKKQTQLLL